MSKKIDWPSLLQRRSAFFLKKARALPGLKRLGPKTPWLMDSSLVSAPAMLKLNKSYRRKGYATDVLSFISPEPFRSQGMLGELVICLPVLKRQAKSMGHPPEAELDILLVHGILHLLGMDHELGVKEAASMRKWESRLLVAGRGKAARKGLIARAGAGS
jgi:probable rRNA maturation factor